MPKPRITIVGLGLIGSSIGLALKKGKVEADIVGHDKDSGVAGRAVKRGAVDKTDWNLISACEGAGLIVLALPLDGVQGSLEALKRYLEPGVTLTDTASTKVPVMQWAAGLAEGVNFIGGDPVLNPRRAIAGQGPEAADADLFQDSTYCLVTSSTAAGNSIQTMTNFVSLLGAKPYFIDAAEHDGLAAGVQHLPALLSTALAAAAMQSQGWRELGKLAGPDFRAATEGMPPDGQAAHRQFMAHRADLVNWIDLVQHHLQELRGMLEREDAEALRTLIERLATERARWLSGSQHEQGPAVDWQSAQGGLSRMLLGGLADRGKKK